MVWAGRPGEPYSISFQWLSIHLHALDAAPIARSIFHCDVISGGAITLRSRDLWNDCSDPVDRQILFPVVDFECSINSLRYKNDTIIGGATK